LAKKKFGRNLSGAELKSFRSHVSALKKQGKIKASIDARSARPYFLSGGKTLQEIVNKNVSKTENIPSRAKARSPFLLRDAPGIKQKGLAAIFNQIEKDPALLARIEALKKPGERWAFEIDGTPSMHAYPDLELLIEDTFKYTGTKASQSIYSKRDKSARLGSRLKLIRWDGSDFSWQDTRSAKLAKLPKKKRARSKRRK
jgi:hypothetical protein